jgi:hypothetical protein
MIKVQQIRYRKNALKHDEGFVAQAYSKLILNDEKIMFFLLRAGKDKNATVYHLHPTQYGKF